MAPKPTYEELERRVRELEAESARSRQAAQAVNADRTYVFRNHLDPADGCLLMSQVWEWTNGGVRGDRGGARGCYRRMSSGMSSKPSSRRNT